MRNYVAHSGSICAMTVHFQQPYVLYYSTECAPVAQLDRVPGYEPGGRRFESFRARHLKAMKFVLIKLLIAVFLICQTSSLLLANEHHADAETQPQSSDIYAEHLQQMISEQIDTIAVYEKQLDKPKITDSDLLVLAEQLIDELQAWIELDLPFLHLERSLRIKGLRNMMVMPNLDVTEKIRRILEAYRIEAEYGFSFESYRGKLSEDDVVVDFMHIGRNILIYKSLDGRQVGAWNRHISDWHSLNNRYRYPVEQAFNVAYKGVAPGILLLPVQLTQTTARNTPPAEQASEPATTPAQTQQIPTEITALETLLKDKKQQASELQSAYYRKLGQTKELIAIARNTAEALQTMIAGSFMPLLLPHYRTSLNPLLQNDQILEIDHIKTLQGLFIELYRLQAETSFFNTEIILEDGTSAMREIVHIGPFSLLYDGELLSYVASVNHPVVLSESPNPFLLLIADSISKADLDVGFVRAPVDLSQGAVLETLDASLSVMDRIWQAGWVAYLISVLGIYGLMLVVYKIVLLRQCLRSVDKQRYDTEYDSGNPLGRILSIADISSNAEETEWQIEQALLREIPLLEWGFSTIKVLIIAAPLLGLLGTVLGMIETFQAISLFGTNDPKIISQGISQALVTTLLGLYVAIPLLLLYTWAMSYNKEIRNILEHQSAGLLVRHAARIR